MSCTTTLAIWPGDKYECIAELRNGWGSGPVVWNELSKRYLRTGDFEYMHKLDKLWPLWHDLSIPLAYRAALMMTYDRMYVLKKDYARAAADIRKFLTDFPIGATTANHWPAIAALFESEPEYPAIALWCTSVSENLFDGPWNEETEEHGPLDWSTAYSVYGELDGLDSPSPASDALRGDGLAGDASPERQDPKDGDSASISKEND